MIGAMAAAYELDETDVPAEEFDRILHVAEPVPLVGVHDFMVPKPKR